MWQVTVMIWHQTESMMLIFIIYPPDYVLGICIQEDIHCPYFLQNFPLRLVTHISKSWWDIFISILGPLRSDTQNKM